MNIQPYRGTNQDIERIADSLREAIQEHSGRPLCGRRLLDTIVKSTSGAVEIADDPGQQEADGGSLVIQDESDYTIYLSPYTTPLRDNFTIAHELGHFFLHFFLQEPHPLTPLGFTRYGSGPVEWQANRFAAALLMPAKLFRDKHIAFEGDGFRISGFFEASRAAVEARGESLNCPVK